MLSVGALAVVVCVLMWIWAQRPQRPANFPPGPPTFLVFGTLPEAIKAARGKFKAVLKECRDKYGDIFGTVMPDKTLIVHMFAFEDIREACARQEFSNRPQAYSFQLRSFGEKLGIIFNDGPSWSEHRRFVLRHLRDLGFGKTSMESVVLDEFEKLYEEMIQDSGRPMKVRYRFNLPVLNILWKLVGSIRHERSDPKAIEHVNIVNTFFTKVGPSSPINVAAWLRFLAPRWSGYTAIVEQRDMTSSMFKDLMKQHKETLDPQNPRDLIDRFLLEMQKEDAADRHFTEKNLSIVGMDLFVAGMETTSTSLSWALLMMVKHLDLQEKVQQEIDRVLGESPPSYEDRLRMPYTEAVLMELARFSNVTRSSAPHATECDTAFKGYHFPKNTMVIMHLEAVHMDPEYWGDPEVFRPERFINADGTIRKDERLIPFGIGKRFCLGESLARMEMFMLFTCLLQRFRFTIVPGQDLSESTAFTVIRQPPEFFVNYEVRRGA